MFNSPGPTARTVPWGIFDFAESGRRRPVAKDYVRDEIFFFISY